MITDALGKAFEINFNSQQIAEEGKGNNFGGSLLLEKIEKLVREIDEARNLRYYSQADKIR